MILDARGESVDAVDPAVAGHDGVVQEALGRVDLPQRPAGVPVKGRQPQAAVEVRSPGDAPLLRRRVLVSQAWE